MLQLCSDPCMVRSYGVHYDVEPYLCMELREGGDLGSLFFMHGRLKESKVVLLARQMCHAICHLHTKGLLHRDIKPDNFGLFGFHGALVRHGRLS